MEEPYKLKIGCGGTQRPRVRSPLLWPLIRSIAYIVLEWRQILDKAGARPGRLGLSVVEGQDRSWSPTATQADPVN